MQVFLVDLALNQPLVDGHSNDLNTYAYFKKLGD